VTVPERRADVVGIFPSEAAIVRLIGAVLLEQNDEWQLQHRYMQVEAMAELVAPILVRRDCFSVNRRRAFRHLNRRSGLVAMVQTLPLPIGHLVRVSFCWVEWMKRLICCKPRVPRMRDCGCYICIWPRPMV